MTGNKTATVETLTAEVRVLMVGSRQVTMSVYGQLDHVEYDEIEPFGRVMPKDAQAGIIYVIGKRTEAGDLVSSWLPCTEAAIKRWITGRSSLAGYERSAANEDDRAARCEDEALGLEETAEKLLGDSYIGTNAHLGNAGYGAGHHDASAARYDQEAARHEQEASSAEDEITRLQALADAAAERRYAAEARRDAEKKRADAAALRAKAQDCRTRKTVHESNAKAHWGMYDKWAEWERRENETVIARAAEWADLPLIVLAGLR